MPSSNTNRISKSIIITVCSGIVVSIFVPPIREAVSWFLSQLWSAVASIWIFITSIHGIPGWLILVGAFSILSSILRLLSHIKPDHDKILNEYNDDIIYGMKWRWAWQNGRIINLWCYCISCDASLVYSDDFGGPFGDGARTDFICEHCNRKKVGSIPGGRKDYAKRAVEREIYRRIRAGEAQIPGVNNH